MRHHIRTLGLVFGASALLSACSFRTAASDATSRPFEVHITPTVLHVGDTINVSYQYLGGMDRQYRILFGDDKGLPDTMLEIGVPTTDPGTFSFVLEPRMMDRRDPTKYREVVPGRSYSIGFVGYFDGKEFGANILHQTVLERPSP